MLGIYHSVDMDGIGSAALLKCCFPDIELIGVDYNQPVDWEAIKRHKGDDVFIVDFCYPWRDMEAINALCCLHWCDHHITSIEEMKCVKGTVWGVRTTEHSGIWCLWEYLSQRKWDGLLQLTSIDGRGYIPPVIELLSEYDCGRVNDMVLDFQYGIKLLSGLTFMDLLSWKELFEGDITKQRVLKRDGKVVKEAAITETLGHLKMYGHEVCFHKHLGVPEDYKVMALNAPSSHDLAAQPFEVYPDYDIYFRYIKVPTGQWRYTLSQHPKHKGTFHAGEFCRRMRDESVATSGGGHEMIAGMLTDKLIFDVVGPLKGRNNG